MTSLIRNTPRQTHKVIFFNNIEVATHENVMFCKYDIRGSCVL